MDIRKRIFSNICTLDAGARRNVHVFSYPVSQKRGLRKFIRNRELAQFCGGILYMTMLALEQPKFKPFF
jgi:hypothetical protein